MAYSTSAKIFVNKLLEFFLLLQRQIVGFAIDRFKTWGEVDGMIPWSSFWEFVEIFFGEKVFIIVILLRYDVGPVFRFRFCGVVLEYVIVIVSVILEVSINVESE